MTTALELKDMGNKYYSDKNFLEAINCYSKAIIKEPETVCYYTNRALCYLKLKQWQFAQQDCEKSLELKEDNFKAYYFKGQALFEMGLYDPALAALFKAQKLATEQKQPVGDDIMKRVRQIKKLKFEQKEEKRLNQEILLQTELNILLKNEMDKQMKKALDSNNLQLAQEIKQSFEEKTCEVNRLFEDVDDRRKKREVPDVLCSKIHFGIMRDPVITPSGITYERKDLEDHLKKIGQFDPVTRRKMTSEELIPNLALKEVIDIFLEENPWAEDY